MTGPRHTAFQLPNTPNVKNFRPFKLPSVLRTIAAAPKIFRLTLSNRRK